MTQAKIAKQLEPVQVYCLLCNYLFVLYECDGEGQIHGRHNTVSCPKCSFEVAIEAYEDDPALLEAVSDRCI